MAVFFQTCVNEQLEVLEKKMKHRFGEEETSGRKGVRSLQNLVMEVKADATADKADIEAATEATTSGVDARDLVEVTWPTCRNGAPLPTNGSIQCKQCFMIKRTSV
eukprot:TRINITY_DN46429_c0_g1_i1.p1 TRINITY_DN46429_c0_g1~~TRINITY_DN46429_c0_g1_i1.p1  ORF type:complete len:106 (-),score=26.05 TRINITY_DN46429_c0_g1_i1:231-548(-)